MHKLAIKISLLRAFIIVTILVKFSFLFFVIREFFIKNLIKKNPNDKKYKESLEINDRFKHQLEFIFTILMASLLIILFNPINRKHIILDNEAKTLLYLFGFLLIITADWAQFIQI